MTASSITPAQREMLKLLAYNKSDEFAFEMKRVLVKYFQKRIDEETERLWNEGILDQNALDRINEEDLHARPK